MAGSNYSTDMTTVCPTETSFIENSTLNVAVSINSNSSNLDTTGLIFDHHETTLASHKFGVIGLPGSLFATIHVTALCCLSTTIVVSAVLLIYLCRSTRFEKTPPSQQTKVTTAKSSTTTSQKDSRSEVESTESQTDQKITTRPPATPSTKYKRTSFWKWNIGERFVVYLAICDLLFSISHTMDHAYMLAIEDNPPDIICTLFGFCVIEFILAQWLIVIFSAVSASSLVVFRKKLYLGRWDWRLLTCAFGGPGALGVFTAYFGLIGPSGAWWV